MHLSPERREFTSFVFKEYLVLLDSLLQVLHQHIFYVLFRFL